MEFNGRGADSQQRRRAAARVRLRAAAALAALACLTVAVAAPLPATAAPSVTVVPPVLTQYVPAALPAGVTLTAAAAVVLELDIDKFGGVSNARVVESAGGALDDAAVAAARQLRFTPASRGGQAIAVRIRFRYLFEPKVVAQRAAPPAPPPPTLPAEATQATAAPAPAPPAAGAVIAGRMRERGTGRPVVGALVVLPGRVTETYSDGEGNFSFDGLAPGSVEVYAPGTEHKPVRQRVTVPREGSVRVELRPERLSYIQYRAVAEGPPEPAQVTRRSLSTEEIQRIPGVYGDSFKVVLNLPGVARPAGGSGQIIVRGSAPQDSQAVIEGVRIPQLYHFAGIYSVFNTDLLDGIDFSASGYAVRYGRRTGGLIESRLKVPGADERWRGYVESNVFHTGFLLQGPIGPNTNLAVAARRSYIDGILALLPADLLPFTLAPRYYDGQVKLDHRFSDRTSATLFLFGSDDSLRAVVPEPPAAFPDARGTLESSIRFAGAIFTLRHDAGSWNARTTLAAVPSSTEASFGDALRFDLQSTQVTLRQDFTFGTGPLQLRTGIDWGWNPYTISLRLPTTANTGERGAGEGQTPGQIAGIRQEGSEYTPGAWVDGVGRFGDLEVVAGLRLDFYRAYRVEAEERVRQRLDETLTPRLNARYRFSDALALKMAAGMASQPPQPQQIGTPPFGNPTLGAQRSFETTVGAELRLTDAIDLDVQAFHKRLWGVAVAGTGLGDDVYRDEGEGRVTGAEILLRHRPVGRFFGWVAYTLQRAERQDGPTEPWRLFGWDQTHILTALGSWKLPANWEIGVRWRFVTGAPYTSAATAVWRDDNDTWQRVPSACVNCERVPAFHQLDVRVDKKWVFDRWLLGVYLDLQNAYNRANPEGVTYSFDASERAYSTGLPIIPSFGVRGEF